MQVSLGDAKQDVDAGKIVKYRRGTAVAVTLKGDMSAVQSTLPGGRLVAGQEFVC